MMINYGGDTGGGRGGDFKGRRVLAQCLFCTRVPLWSVYHVCHIVTALSSKTVLKSD